MENNAEKILSHYEQFFRDYKDVKVFGDENHTLQMLIYDKVFAGCKTVASFGLSKYLSKQCEVVMAVDAEYETSTKVLANALFYAIQNNIQISEGSFIEGVANIDRQFSEKYGKTAIYFTYPFCFPDEFAQNGECRFMLAFFITQDEAEYLKKNGSDAFEDYLTDKDCDVFELNRR
ncbi:suppressor of fused domain protein [Butyrivibrio proteoclasticus]|uniref:suppressor of fused domain protein n=1 Tax=Butyrivibrio proteoclasticus TaxID=43305 RepID=UPI00047C5EE1|nr:suppressor of fused domain protein [Butyrivibrio proteoclasticus]